MGPAQLGYFKERLLGLKGGMRFSQELLQRLHATATDASDAAGGVAGEEMTALTRVHLARVMQQLREIDAALIRIEAGEFGWCRDSGQMIGFQRLLVFPTAACASTRSRVVNNQL
jgi:DnaK suppressor protein